MKNSFDGITWFAIKSGLVSSMSGGEVAHSFKRLGWSRVLTTACATPLWIIVLTRTESAEQILSREFREKIFGSHFSWIEVLGVFLSCILMQLCLGIIRLVLRHHFVLKASFSWLGMVSVAFFTVSLMLANGEAMPLVGFLIVCVLTLGISEGVGNTLTKSSIEA
jgi:hypothetical protein